MLRTTKAAEAVISRPQLRILTPSILGLPAEIANRKTLSDESMSSAYSPIESPIAELARGIRSLRISPRHGSPSSPLTPDFASLAQARAQILTRILHQLPIDTSRLDDKDVQVTNNGIVPNERAMRVAAQPEISEESSHESQRQVKSFLERIEEEKEKLAEVDNELGFYRSDELLDDLTSDEAEEAQRLQRRKVHLERNMLELESSLASYIEIVRQKSSDEAQSNVNITETKNDIITSTRPVEHHRAAEESMDTSSERSLAGTYSEGTWAFVPGEKALPPSSERM
ncbi:hypothetical protein LIA77_10539 [Sarocladium implicatum]|nr:hypothetical protein LIA77_10539 [Sarocladium implicatum]